MSWLLWLAHHSGFPTSLCCLCESYLPPEIYELLWFEDYVVERTLQTSSLERAILMVCREAQWRLTEKEQDQICTFAETVPERRIWLEIDRQKQQNKSKRQWDHRVLIQPRALEDAFKDVLHEGHPTDAMLLLDWAECWLHVDQREEPRTTYVSVIDILKRRMEQPSRHPDDHWRWDGRPPPRWPQLEMDL